MVNRVQRRPLDEASSRGPALPMPTMRQLRARETQRLADPRPMTAARRRRSADRQFRPGGLRRSAAHPQPGRRGRQGERRHVARPRIRRCSWCSGHVRQSTHRRGGANQWPTEAEQPGGRSRNGRHHDRSERGSRECRSRPPGQGLHRGRRRARARVGRSARSRSWSRAASSRARSCRAAAPTWRRPPRRKQRCGAAVGGGGTRRRSERIVRARAAAGAVGTHARCRGCEQRCLRLERSGPVDRRLTEATGLGRSGCALHRGHRRRRLERFPAT